MMQRWNVMRQDKTSEKIVASRYVDAEKRTTMGQNTGNAGNTRLK